MPNGYLGSPSLLTSTSNMELIPTKPSNWTMGYSFNKFTFNNVNLPCTVTINNGNPIYLLTGQGFECGLGDAPITSFIVAESGIQLNWIGCW